MITTYGESDADDELALGVDELDVDESSVDSTMPCDEMLVLVGVSVEVIGLVQGTRRAFTRSHCLDLVEDYKVQFNQGFF
jgi:hypothetical protein